MLARVMNFHKYLLIKRIIDIIISVIALLLILPFIIPVMILIKIDSKGPVIFKQKRIGINKSYFTIYKFRTMKIETPSEVPTHLLNDPGKWVTRTGRFLRRTSIDELPQFLNILIGDMSIIGPRPALWNQHDLIEERDKYGANNVPVGLVGWAQRYGRRELPVHIKAKLDGEYVSNLGIAMDVKCLLGTILSFIKQKNINDGSL